MTGSSALLASHLIEQKILLFRGHRVMLDSDLALLYGVPTKALTRAVRRNHDRFPDDFMFRLTPEEVELLRRHFGTSSSSLPTDPSVSWGGRRYLPYVFTEQGVAMLSSVLRSKRAILVNIEIMRAFVRIKQMLASNKELSRRVDELEKKYDANFKDVFDVIRRLMTPPSVPTKRRIGFLAAKF